MWLLATIHERNRSTKKALTIYKICSHYYKRVNDKKLRAINAFNIGKLRKNTNAMSRIIRIFINNNFESTTHLFKEDMDDMKILVKMLKELESLDMKKFIYILDNLDNNEFKEALAKSLVA